MRIMGHSYNEIRARLGIPKSTLSVWFKGLVLSEQARARLAERVRVGTLNGLVKRNKLQTHKARRRALQVRLRSESEVPNLNKKDLMLAGTFLYWAEGYKRPVIRGGKERTAHRISFLNSDPDIVRIFVCFLEEVLEIPRDRIYVCMRLYEHINKDEAKRHWMKASGLSSKHFKNTTYVVSGASKRKRPYNRLPYGTAQIAVNDTEKFHRLMGLIDGVKKQFHRGIVPSSLG